jgi:hypothetical protein
MNDITFLFVKLTGDPPPTARRPKRRFWVLLAVGAVLISVCVARPDLRPLVRTLLRAFREAV